MILNSCGCVSESLDIRGVMHLSLVALSQFRTRVVYGNMFTCWRWVVYTLIWIASWWVYIYVCLVLRLSISWTWFGVSKLIIKNDCETTLFVDRWFIISTFSWCLCLHFDESDAWSAFVSFMLWKKRVVWLFLTRLLLQKSWFISNIRLL